MREDVIAAEADAFMMECADLKTACAFEDAGALLFQRAPIISMACTILAEGDASGFDERGRFAVIGRFVVERIREAAMRRAAQQIGVT